ncbi:MAG: hypothetical protein Q8O30_00060 [Candidatus Omnitrophota bacterium]|nr:hypothetical protein [Candidatus Omnitrophota bacterium]
MIYLLALSALLVSTFFGFLFLRLIDKENKIGILEGLGLSYGLGLGIIAVIMTYLSLAGISFNTFNILASFILILILGVIFNKISVKPGKAHLKFRFGCGKMGRLETFLLGAIFFEVSFIFFISLIKPLESWDAVGHWGAKAKTIYFLKSLPLDLFSRPCIKDIVDTGDYPWLWPFSQDYVYSFIGFFDDFASKIAGPFFFASCLVVFYNILRRVNLKRLYALIFTFFLASIPHFNNFASNGYADLILGYYYCVSFLYLYLWFRNNDRIYLFLSIIFTAMACYVKCEALLLTLISVLTFLSFVLCSKSENRGSAFKSFVFYVFMVVLLSLPMFLLKYFTSANITNQAVSIKLFSEFRLQNLFRISPIIYAYQKQLFGVKYWNLTGVLFLISVFLACRRGILFNKEFRFLTIVIWLIFLAHISFFMISKDVRQYLVPLSRMLLHFLPLVVFFIAVIFQHEERRGKQS